jgi:ABC-type phosphate/phosphonate transport system substrate-binding protein
LILSIIKIDKILKPMKKKIILILSLAAIFITVSSCASSVKKRKGCRGNGSWYGNRNLGAVEQNNQQEIYQLSASINK